MPKIITYGNAGFFTEFLLLVFLPVIAYD